MAPRAGVLDWKQRRSWVAAFISLWFLTATWFAASGCGSLTSSPWWSSLKVEIKIQLPLWSCLCQVSITATSKKYRESVAGMSCWTVLKLKGWGASSTGMSSRVKSQLLLHGRASNSKLKEKHFNSVWWIYIKQTTLCIMLESEYKNITAIMSQSSRIRFCRCRYHKGRCGTG